MDYPDHEQNVIVTLADGSETLAYRYYGNWWTGQAENPADIVIHNVVSWREVE